MKGYVALIKAVVAFAIATAPLAGFAKESPDFASTPTTNATASQEAHQEAVDMMAEENSAPQEIKDLRAAEVGSFFQGSLNEGVDPTPAEKSRFTAALDKLKNYVTRKDDSNQFKNLTPETIAPMVEKLNRERLLRPVRMGMITEPIAKWTMETFLVKAMIASYGKTNGLAGKISSMVQKDMRGLTVKAAMFATAVAIAYIDHRFLGSWIWHGLETNLSWGLKMTIGGGIVGSLLSWFMQPTNELATTWMNRLTGTPAALYNKGLNYLKPSGGSDRQADSNMSPRSIRADANYANFAGQSEQDQLANWDYLMNISVEQAVHSQKLLRPTQANGRSQLVGAVVDLQNSAAFAFALDSNLAIHSVEAGLILQKYYTKFQGNEDKIDRLEALYEEYQAVCTAAWSQSMDDNQKQQAKQEFDRIESDLKGLGVKDGDLVKLWNIQLARAKTVSALVTGLNVNEFKRFANAEMNRNAVYKRIEETTYHGFNLQEFVRNYEALMQDQQVAMGFKNSRISQPACDILLERIMKPAPMQ